MVIIILNILSRKASFTGQWAIIGILIGFIIIGLVTKLYISIFLGLNSDSAGIGLMAMEIGKYHNYLLAGYHLPSANSYIYTELITFQLLPQILTNYNPVALKIVVFVIFTLSILIFGYLIFSITGKKIPALIFGAFAVNLAPEGYDWFAQPTYHTATIFYGGLILLLFLYVNKAIQQGKNDVVNRTGKSTFPHILPLYSCLLLALIFITVFSDTIVLIWVILPFTLAYIIFYQKKTVEMNTILVLSVIISGIAYGIKTFLIPGWYGADYGMKSISDIFFINIPLFSKAQIVLLNSGLNFLVNEGIGAPLVILSAFSFIVLIVYGIRNIIKDIISAHGEKKFFYEILILSIGLIFLTFISSSYILGMSGGRYLTYGVLVIVILLALSYPKEEPSFMLLIFVVLLFSALSGFFYVSSLDTIPNQGEYRLIKYQTEKNLTFGYGDYWNSNIITYLSGEKVTILSVNYVEKGFRRDLLNSCDRRWEEKHGNTFFIGNGSWISLGDQKATGVSMDTSGSAGEWFSVIRGSDNHLYFNQYTKSKNSWSGWTALGGTTYDQPAVAYTGNNFIHIVVRGTDDNLYWKSLNLITNTWDTGWTSLGGHTASAPALLSLASSQISGDPVDLPELWLAIRGTDNHLYVKQYNPAGGWDSEWQTWGGTTYDRPALALWYDEGTGNGILTLGVRGIDNKVCLKNLTFGTNGTAMGFWDKPGGSTLNAPLLRYKDGILFVFIRGTNNQVYYKMGSDSFKGLGGTTINMPDVHNFPDKPFFEVSITGQNSGIYNNLLNVTTHQWSGWVGMGHSAGGSPIISGIDGSSGILAIRGIDDRIYVKFI